MLSSTKEDPHEKETKMATNQVQYIACTMHYT
jgi:hypothetical protein